MRNNRHSWLLLTLTAILAATIWFRFSYPQLAFISLSVDRKQAIETAREFLHNENSAVDDYRIATIFNADTATNRYLQKALGFERMLRFLQQYDVDLFYWVVRFFKEGEKEEHLITVSSSSGQIIAYRHLIPETRAIPIVDKLEAQEMAAQLLQEHFGFESANYQIKTQSTERKENRQEYDFHWNVKSVAIPWDTHDDSSRALLLRGATISGDTVLSFFKNHLQVPDDFQRQITRMKQGGRQIATIVHLFYMLLFASSVFYIVVRRNHLAMAKTKRFYLFIAAGIFLLSLGGSFFNGYESLLFHYQTSTSLPAYLRDHLLQIAIHSFILCLAIIVPALAGELLHFERLDSRREGAFLHYIRASFTTRSLTRSIILGYFVFIILLGLQSAIIHVGQRFWGVWIEHDWMIQWSTFYWPLLAIITLGIKAAFGEELLYRLYGLNLGIKILKSRWLSILLLSLLWGFSHSQYMVFPVWFRGIEVSLLGILLGWVYLRWGLITVLVAHYLFDVFWGGAPMLLGEGGTIKMLQCVGALLIPAILALVAFSRNRPNDEQPLEWSLNAQQRFLCQVLEPYLREQMQGTAGETITSPKQMKQDLTCHGWDPAVVEVALEKFQKRTPQKRNESS